MSWKEIGIGKWPRVDSNPGPRGHSDPFMAGAAACATVPPYYLFNNFITQGVRDKCVHTEMPPIMPSIVKSKCTVPWMIRPLINPHV